MAMRGLPVLLLGAASFAFAQAPAPKPVPAPPAAVPPPAAAPTAPAAAAREAETKRIQAALAALREQQQAVYQQFQMAQEMRRYEMGRPDPVAPPPSGVAPPPGNYEELLAERQRREARIRELSAEIDRLYARFREIEEERRALVEQLAAPPGE